MLEWNPHAYMPPASNEIHGRDIESPPSR
jgi:hypothetical protein